MSLSDADAPGKPGGGDVASLSCHADDATPAGGTSEDALHKPAHAPANRCPLRHANDAGRKATQWEIVNRCDRPSCPDCGAFKMRGRVRAAQAVAAAWSYPRFAVTLLFEPVLVADLSPPYLDERYETLDSVRVALKAHPGVAAYLLKFEVDQAKQVAPGVPMAVAHAHLDLMTLCHDPQAVLGQCLPKGFGDVLIVDDPDLGWVAYLGKGAVPKLIAADRNPKVLHAIGKKLDGWAKATKLRPFWFGGAYDLRTHNRMALGAGIAKALADPENWPGMLGAIRRCQARRYAKRLVSVIKHGKHAPFYLGKWHLDGPIGKRGRFVPKEVV